MASLHQLWGRQGGLAFAAANDVDTAAARARAGRDRKIRDQVLAKAEARGETLTEAELERRIKAHKAQHIAVMTANSVRSRAARKAGIAGGAR